MTKITAYPQRKPNIQIVPQLLPNPEGIEGYWLNSSILANYPHIYTENGRYALEHILGFVSEFPCMKSLAYRDDDVMKGLRYDEIIVPAGVSSTHPLGEVILKAQASGLSLKPEKVPSCKDLGGDIPEMRFFLTEGVSFLVVSEMVGDYQSVMVYGWPGGKLHYRNHPESAAELREIVDVQAKNRQTIAPPMPPPPPPVPPVEEKAQDAPLTVIGKILKEAGLKKEDTDIPSFNPSGNLLKDVRGLGFESMGTSDMGHVMQFVRPDDQTIQVCRGNGVTLLKSTSYTVRILGRDGECIEAFQNLNAREAASKANDLMQEANHDMEMPKP